MLDKGIISGKEHRREYYDSRRIDRSCRAHGGCDYCGRNRQFNHKKAEIASLEALQAYLNGEDIDE